MGDMPVATPRTHSDDYADDQIAYRLGQTAQVEERSSMADFPFSSLTLSRYPKHSAKGLTE